MSVFNKNIIGFEIAMDESYSVHIRNSLCDFNQNLLLLFIAQPKRRPEKSCHVPSFCEVRSGLQRIIGKFENKDILRFTVFVTSRNAVEREDALVVHHSLDANLLHDQSRTDVFLHLLQSDDFIVPNAACDHE